MAYEKFVTPVFRGSFPHLFELNQYGDGDPKFSIAAVFNLKEMTTKDKERYKGLLKALDKACQEKFKKPWKECCKDRNFKEGLRDGSTKELEGYGEGTMFANLSTKSRPGVIDLDRKTISPEEGNADEVYPGAYFRATVTVYAYDNKSKGVAFGLQNIQKVKDGERLDSRTDAAEDFEGEEVDDEWLNNDTETEEDDPFA